MIAQELIVTISYEALKTQAQVPHSEILILSSNGTLAKKTQIPESISDLLNQNFQERSLVTCIFKAFQKIFIREVWKNPNSESLKKGLGSFFIFASQVILIIYLKQGTTRLKRESYTGSKESNAG